MEMSWQTATRSPFASREIASGPAAIAGSQPDKAPVTIAIAVNAIPRFIDMRLKVPPPA